MKFKIKLTFRLITNSIIFYIFGSVILRLFGVTSIKFFLYSLSPFAAVVMAFLFYLIIMFFVVYLYQLNDRLKPKFITFINRFKSKK